MMTWDDSNFRSAMAAASEYTKRAPADAINTAAYHVALFFVSEMDKVPMARMDSELAATLSPGVLKSGKLSKNKKRQRENVSVAVGGAGRSETTPLAVMIILARANLTGKGGQSNYNLRTNNRYAISKDALKGGKAVMDGFIRRMIKGRHSSSGFIASTMIPAAKQLEAVLPARYRRGAPPTDPTARQIGKPKGGSNPAVRGSSDVTCVIFSTIGDGGVNAARQLEALWQHGGPAMQRALDKEAEMQFLFVSQEEWKAAGRSHPEFVS